MYNNSQSNTLWMGEIDYKMDECFIRKIFSSYRKNNKNLNNKK